MLFNALNGFPPPLAYDNNPLGGALDRDDPPPLLPPPIILGKFSISVNGSLGLTLILVYSPVLIFTRLGFPKRIDPNPSNGAFASVGFSLKKPNHGSVAPVSLLGVIGDFAFRSTPSSSLDSSGSLNAFA